jgi:hypothetical protein
MKLMLVLGTGAIYSKLNAILKPLAVETIVYRHIQKAMDNIEEVDPDAVMIDAGAFPRHWKSFVPFIRETGRQKHCPVILINRGCSKPPGKDRKGEGDLMRLQLQKLSARSPRHENCKRNHWRSASAP